MNERIIKLGLDADVLNYIDHETTRRYFINGHADLEEVEKFAELIVRECAEVVQEGRWMVPPSQEQLARSIKQHFGVEE
ncbi:MAG: hypothetical protein VW518_10010 [Burkholderiaceae bacterium]